MTEDVREPAAYAVGIDAARDRMIAFATSCSEREWQTLAPT